MMEATDRLLATINYEGLVEALADAVVVCDANGAINLWNAAAERLFGFTKAEAVGASLDLIVPERWRERHWAGYERVMATGDTRYGRDVLRVPATHREGRALSIAFTVALLHNEEEKVTGIAAVIRDDTARFAEEKDLRNRLAELEKKNNT